MTTTTVTPLLKRLKLGAVLNTLPETRREQIGILPADHTDR